MLTALQAAEAQFETNAEAALAGDTEAEARLVILTMHSDPALAGLRARAETVLQQIARRDKPNAQTNS